MPRRPVTPKKVGALPVAGSDEQKQTNEIGMAIPLLAGCDIAGCDITGDALLTQRALASYIVQRQAHYHFTAKGNQPTLQRISRWRSSSAVWRISFRLHLRTMAALRRGVFGAARRSTPTLTFRMSARCF